MEMKKFLMLIFLAGCLPHSSVLTKQLPKGECLVNVTWKGEDLWYLTKPCDGEGPYVLTRQKGVNASQIVIR
jgi:hypothetical protein